MRASPSNSTDQPVRLLCAWNLDGQFCEFPGVHSADLFGKGPWYCRGHHRCADAAAGAQILHDSLYGPPVTAESIRIAATERAGREAAQFCVSLGLTTVAEKRAWIAARLKDVGRGKASKRWAFDLLAKRDRGEPISPLQEELAKRATEGRPGLPDRIPGADDEAVAIVVAEESAW